MRAIQPQNKAAVASDQVVTRDFITIFARRFSDGSDVTWRAWSDYGTITAQVINPTNGLIEQFDFEGIGGVISISDMAWGNALSVADVTITLSAIDSEVERLFREYDLQRAGVHLHRGFFAPLSMQLVAPAEDLFRGFVDESSAVTPAADGEATLTLTVVPHTQELSRSSAAKRSDADQRRRDPNDSFFQHAATVGSWEIRWGQE